MRSLLLNSTVAITTVAVDYVVKRFVESSFAMHDPMDLLPFLAIFRTNNTGIAFSMFDWLDDRWLIAIPLAIIVFVLWLARRTEPGQWIARLGFAFIIGGAIGNLIDRVMLGHVVDYILFHLGDWSFAIFNLADAFITVGAGLVLLQEVVDWRKAAESRT